MQFIDQEVSFYKRELEYDSYYEGIGMKEKTRSYKEGYKLLHLCVDGSSCESCDHHILYSAVPVD